MKKELKHTDCGLSVIGNNGLLQATKSPVDALLEASNIWASYPHFAVTLSPTQPAGSLENKLFSRRKPR